MTTLKYGSFWDSTGSISWNLVILTWNLQTSSPPPNEIYKLPLMVSQRPPKLPKWSNLAQFDFQQKHPGPAKDSPLQRESSTKCAHRIAHGGWLRIDGYPSKLQPSWKHRKTAEYIGKHLWNIWYHPENNWGSIIDNLVQFEKDFNTYTEMLDMVVISDQTNS